MFNFCEVFFGRATVTDAGRANTCRRKFTAPWLQTEVQKMKQLPKMSFTQKQFDNFRQIKLHFLAQTKQPRETHGP